MYVCMCVCIYIYICVYVHSIKKLSLCLDTYYKWKLFHYSAYFYYYLWASLHFLLLFMGSAILFQLTFTFIYSTFNNKFLVSAK